MEREREMEEDGSMAFTREMVRTASEEGRVRRDGWRRKTERRMSQWDGGGGRCTETEAV